MPAFFHTGLLVPVGMGLQEGESLRTLPSRSPKGPVFVLLKTSVRKEIETEV